MIREIWTLRSLRHQVFRQILEAWEDDIARELNLTITDKGAWERRASSRLGSFLRRVDGEGRIVTDLGRLARNLEPTGIMFAIFAPIYGNSYLVQSNVVPIIIDCWGDSLDRMALALSKVKAVVVTNSELVKELQTRCPGLAVLYVPLAVESAVCGRRELKTYDLVQVGRQNPKLHQWAIRLTDERPTIEYRFVEQKSQWPKWISTKHGEISGGLSRTEYLTTLGSARVALVSAPGIDGGEVRTGGYNPVTPRFYEAAALGCRMVGRYPMQGLDYVANKIGTVCANVDSYEAFVCAVDTAILAGPDNSESTRDFVFDHTGTAMARRLRDKLAPLGLCFPTR